MITMLEKGRELNNMKNCKSYQDTKGCTSLTRRYTVYGRYNCVIELLIFLDDALALSDACFLLRTLYKRDIYSALKFSFMSW